jgi:hypothetical protein
VVRGTVSPLMAIMGGVASSPACATGPRSHKRLAPRMIAGLARPSSGRVTVAGIESQAGPAFRRQIGYLAQEPAFYPWKSLTDWTDTPRPSMPMVRGDKSRADSAERSTAIRRSDSGSAGSWAEATTTVDASACCPKSA